MKMTRPTSAHYRRVGRSRLKPVARSLALAASVHPMGQIRRPLVRCRPPARRSQDGVEQLTGVRFLENLADPRGGVGPLWRAGIGRQPVGGSGFGDVPELRDEHREVSALIHCRWAAGHKHQRR